MRKYKNRKTTVGGIVFDSAKEARRYSALLIVQKCGEIRGLELQKRYEIIHAQAGERAVHYIADFVYFNKCNELIVEDVKSAATKKLPLYIIKRKLMLLMHGIRIVET